MRQLRHSASINKTFNCHENEKSRSKAAFFLIARLFVIVKDIIKPQLDEDGITTIGLFDFLDDISEIYLEFYNLTEQEKKNINSINFDYELFKNRITNFFICNIKNLKINTCFYCDMTFINFYTSENGKNKKQFALDHFIPKENCKMFSLSLYNLIPSCTNCNSGSKGSNFSYIDLAECKTKDKLASAFPTSSTYNWTEFMNFKILPKNINAISRLLYSEKYEDFNIELDSKNEIYKEESKIFEIIPKYKFFLKQFLNQIDKYRIYDKNFFYLINKSFSLSFTAFLYEAIFNEKLRKDNQLPFNKIYDDIKNIFYKSENKKKLTVFLLPLPRL